MRNLLAAATVALLPLSAIADPVTWTFYETSCTANFGPAGNCSPAAPLDLVDLTLPTPGAAVGAVGLGLGNGLPPTGNFIGSGWRLTIHGGGAGTITLDPDVAPYFTGSTGLYADFLTLPGTFWWWTASTILVNFSINDTRGEMDSLGAVANCPYDSQCIFAGHWVVAPVPEPPTLLSWAAVALAGIWLIRRHGPVSGG